VNRGGGTGGVVVARGDGVREGKEGRGISSDVANVRLTCWGLAD
jgi:hypothetical protein